MILFDVLKASAGLPVDDPMAVLFAKQMAGTHFVRETEGVPPLQIVSTGKPLTEYRIYGNSVQDGTPSPENLIEVQSVGDKTSNLFNENDVTYGYWITDTGNVSNAVISARYNRDIAVITGKTICVRAYGERQFNIAIGYYDADNAFILRVTSMNGSLVSTPPANAAYGVVYVANNRIASTVPITPEELASYKIMLTYGDSTAYEPYGYKFPVVVTGKNLFKLQDLLDSGSGELPGSTLILTNLLTIKVKPNTDYTLSSDVAGSTSGTSATNRSLYFNDANTQYAVFDGHPVTVNSGSSGILKIGLMADRPNAEPIVNGTASIQLEEGSEATAYEPYHEERMTFYLDEPLASGDVLSYPEQVLKHTDGTAEPVTLPKIPTFDGTTVITVDTKIQPSNMYVKYTGKQ